MILFLLHVTELHIFVVLSTSASSSLTTNYIEEFKAPTEILIGGGVTKSGATEEIEVLKIPHPMATTQTSEKKLLIPILPNRMAYHIMAYCHGDLLTFGGRVDQTHYKSVYALQFEFKGENVLDGRWGKRNDLNMFRAAASFTTIGDGHLWVTGGNKISNLSEVCINGTWKQSYELPDTRWGHSIVRVSDEKYIMTGGSNVEDFVLAGQDIFTFDTKSARWNLSTVKLQHMRMYHVSYYDENQNEVHIVGGTTGLNPQTPLTTEILNLNEMKIKAGPSLPTNFTQGGCMVKDRYGRVFLMAGNMDEKSIMEYVNGTYYALMGKPILRRAKQAAACTILKH